jgi:hypothetical protein
VGSVQYNYSTDNFESQPQPQASILHPASPASVRRMSRLIFSPNHGRILEGSLRWIAGLMAAWNAVSNPPASIPQPSCTSIEENNCLHNPDFRRGTVGVVMLSLRTRRPLGNMDHTSSKSASSSSESSSSFFLLFEVPIPIPLPILLPGAVLVAGLLAFPTSSNSSSSSSLSSVFS